MRSDAPDRNAGDRCVLAANVSEQPAGLARGSAHCLGGQPERLDQVVRPAARPGVDQPRGRRDRRLVGERAGQPQAHQVGDHRDVLRRLGDRAARLREQLEDRVDRHRLDAGARVELGRRDAAGRELDHSLCARVAVVERDAEQPV